MNKIYTYTAWPHYKHMHALFAKAVKEMINHNKVSAIFIVDHLYQFHTQPLGQTTTFMDFIDYSYFTRDSWLGSLSPYSAKRAACPPHLTRCLWRSSYVATSSAYSCLHCQHFLNAYMVRVRDDVMTVLSVLSRVSAQRSDLSGGF